MAKTKISLRIRYVPRFTQQRVFRDLFSLPKTLTCGKLFVMNTLLLIILVRIYVAVCLGSYGYISICRSRVLFERQLYLRNHVSLL